MTSGDAILSSDGHSPIVLSRAAAERQGCGHRPSADRVHRERLFRESNERSLGALVPAALLQQQLAIEFEGR